MSKIDFVLRRIRDAAIAMWQKIPVNVRQWIKGAEVAVVTALVSGFVAAPASDFTTKKGIMEFVAGVGATAYGALRLYMTQSPVQNVIKEDVVSSVKTQVGAVSQTTTVASSKETQ